MTRAHAHSEILTAAKFGAVGCVGFAVDAALLHLGVKAGLSPLAARVISLGCAMQVTFLINGFLVFRCLKRVTCLRQWAAYMSSNGVGNLCNYLIFAGLVTSRAPLASRHYVALAIGSASAYLINYAGVRLLAFGRPQGPGPGVCPPVEAEAPPAEAIQV
jgi:putative flippase GtrA